MIYTNRTKLSSRHATAAAAARAADPVCRCDGAAFFFVKGGGFGYLFGRIFGGGIRICIFMIHFSGMSDPGLINFNPDPQAWVLLVCLTEGFYFVIGRGVERGLKNPLSISFWGFVNIPFYKASSFQINKGNIRKVPLSRSFLYIYIYIYLYLCSTQNYKKKAI